MREFLVFSGQKHSYCVQSYDNCSEMHEIRMQLKCYACKNMAQQDIIVITTGGK